ncbi:MAG: 2-hydroxyacid dehydrogenase [Alphaproteobacteria bacterium]|nr:2-hydroxyacid dehydrogenase [Alphaproteobacteria bacterium]
MPDRSISDTPRDQTSENVLLMIRRDADSALPMLRDALTTQWRIEMWNPGEPMADLEALAPDITAMCGGALGEDWPAMPKLGLYQIPFTGYDWMRPEHLKAGVPVCNTFEHETAIAEYVLCAMLEWETGLHRSATRFKEVGWEKRGVGGGPEHGEVRDKTVGIVGYGHIGREVALRARAFGMRVIGNARSEKPCPPELDWLGTGADLHRLLGESDYVLIACPLTAETEGLIGAAEFAAMKDSTVVINVGRGRVIQEDALYRALATRTIQGAVIDVWYRYLDKDGISKRPSDLPFHLLDNVVMTPHNSGWTRAMRQRRWKFVAANLDRFARGEPLENLVLTGSRNAP